MILSALIAKHTSLHRKTPLAMRTLSFSTDARMDRVLRRLVPFAPLLPSVPTAPAYRSLR